MFGPDFDLTLAEAKKGSRAALGALYREFNPALRRFMVARAPSDGEDLAADVWVAVAPKIAEFEGDERGFRAWLFTFGRRRVIDHYRRTGRRGPVVPLHEEHEMPARENPEAEALSRLSAAEAAQLLSAHLTADQCEVLMMRIYGGLDVNDVAAAMERTDTWVRVTQHRAIQRLARRLGSHLDVTQ
jgi:RNA polymerase sigma-70 factor (ECF subfamily)